MGEGAKHTFGVFGVLPINIIFLLLLEYRTLLDRLQALCLEAGRGVCIAHVVSRRYTAYTFAGLAGFCAFKVLNLILECQPARGGSNLDFRRKH